MCGIYCYIGKKKALPIITTGLTTLEYRGYDSAGIAYIKNNKVNIIKEKGKLENLKKLLNNNEKTYIAIGHTRWSTHGKADKINAHPHKQGNITIVHNGIIENYKELKNELVEYNLKSETDTEILCCLIDKLYKENNNIIKVLSKLKNIVKGSYALGLIIDDNLNSIYAIKKNSPLILAKSNIGNFIASDIPAILNYTNKYILLENDEFAKLTKDDITIYDEDGNNINKKTNTYEQSLIASSKNNYEHFMLKEIYEQPDVFYNTINAINELPDLTKYNKIHIVGCGSAYHAGLVGKYLIEKYKNIEVQVELASEYRYKKVFYDKKNLVIFISQSGETADTLACVKKVKEDNIDTLGIVNVISSSIAREVDKVIYTKAGCEIAVATTKAYTAQITILSMLANKNISNISNLMNDILNNDYLKIAKLLYKSNNIFFIGRGIDYALAMEGSLKLKEISYINTQAYSAGELKHGTISLIDDNSYIIAINTNKELSEKTISNIKETQARGAKVIYITTKELEQEFLDYDEIIVLPNTLEHLQPILTIIPLQLIAYEVAKLKGCDIDKPKNLAKSVTVE